MKKFVGDSVDFLADSLAYSWRTPGGLAGGLLADSLAKTLSRIVSLENGYLGSHILPKTA
jgi:hypothetical protein